MARFNGHLEGQPHVDRMLEAHWANWVQTTLPALGDQTPLEAVQDADGRDIGMALLDDMERREQNPIAGMRPPQYIDRARRQLGL